MTDRPYFFIEYVAHYTNGRERSSIAGCLNRAMESFGNAELVHVERTGTLEYVVVIKVRRENNENQSRSRL